MGQSFIACDRDQSFLMPPDVRGWLAPGHLAWFVIDAVAAMDLEAFYGAYRRDGRSRPAYEPAMMVALLLYAYARGMRSSRAIERACEEDVAFRVIAAQAKPDHATVARFVERHQDALAGVFGMVLTLCAAAGLANVAVIAVDGSKVHANASRDENLDYEQLAREILEEAKAVDAAEDKLYGDARGDELPEQLRTGEGRRAWLREAKRQLEERREREARPVARDRPKRVKDAKWRLEEELWTEARANAAYEHYRAHGQMKNGRRLGAHSPPKPWTPPEVPQGRINVTDPDSRVVKGLRGFIQGYNAQAVTNEHQIILAAEIMVAAPDFGHLEPMVDATQRELQAAGVTQTPGVLLADAGYWHQQQMDNIIERGIQILIAPDASRRKSPRPGWGGGYYAFMRRA
ncbi:MAG: transposase, partial [Actinobacteria bacterium]|nr:transposase [Actinomycetota bacterium]